MTSFISTLISALILAISPPEKNRKDEQLECVRWGWSGDVFERKVYCLQWRKKDRSKR